MAYSHYQKYVHCTKVYIVFGFLIQPRNFSLFYALHPIQKLNAYGQAKIISQLSIFSGLILFINMREKKIWLFELFGMNPNIFRLAVTKFLAITFRFKTYFSFTIPYACNALKKNDNKCACWFI